RQAAKARLAFAQRLLGLLAAQELADLAADDARGLEQPLVGLAHRLAGEAQHADDPVLRDDGEGDAAVQAGAFPHRAVLGAAIARRVVRPDRLAGFQDRAGDAFSRAKRHVARTYEELADQRIFHRPGVLEAQHAVVDAEVAPARPAFGAANGADHRAQAARSVVGLGERARHLVLELEQHLAALLLGDVAADAAIAAEASVGAEQRLAAHAEVAQRAVGRGTPHQHVVERLALVEHRPVRRPSALDLQVAVPAALSDQALPQAFVAAGNLAALQASEAVFGVQLPVPVGGKVGQAAETLLAVAYRVLGVGALEVLAEHRGDHLQRLGQPLVRRPEALGGEGEDARHAAAEPHR